MSELLHRHHRPPTPARSAAATLGGWLRHRTDATGWQGTGPLSSRQPPGTRRKIGDTPDPLAGGVAWPEGIRDLAWRS